MSKKIAIIAANNIRYSPYIYFYSDLFENNHFDYDLFFPDRNHINEKWKGKYFKFCWFDNLPVALNYLIYSIRVRNTVRNKYDYLVILTGQNATFLSTWLALHFKDRYIVDIRDYSHESNYFYSFLEKIALKNALLRVISSEQFKVFLPDYNYLVSHNISYDNSYNVKPFEKHINPIVIGYVGSISYKTQIEKLIGLISNDNRFCFHIYGNGPDAKYIKRIVERLNCSRIKYYGEYSSSEKPGIINSIDILFNAYGNQSLLLKCALSNKLYDAMYYHKLVLNSPETYMEKMCGPCGFSMDFEDQLALEKLYSWYNSLRDNDINEYQYEMNNYFISENTSTKRLIIECLKGD